MKRTVFRLLLLSLPFPLSAAELSLYYLPNLAVQYEGTGFRQTPGSWEFKAKPKAGGQGLRWRGGAFQAQLWRNNPYFSPDTGNGGQFGRDRLAVHVLVLDARVPLTGPGVEAVAGLSGVQADFDRKDVFFNGATDPAGAREQLQALGPVLGLHGRAGRPRENGWSPWADGEVLLGHFLWTRNRLRADGGSISREGFSYLFRAEAGFRRGPWRLGLGVVRQMHEVLVPGGRTLPNGGVVSLPINKLDLQGTFLSVTYEL